MYMSRCYYSMCVYLGMVKAFSAIVTLMDALVVIICVGSIVFIMHTFYRGYFLGKVWLLLCSVMSCDAMLSNASIV